MRILMLNNEFPPLGGGTGTVNRAILLRLSGVESLEIDLVTSATDKKASEERIAPNIRILKVPVNPRLLHHATNRELITYAVYGFPLALRLHREKAYDACLAWSAVPAGAMALLLLRSQGLHYAVRVCGPDIPGFERRYAPLYPLLKPLIGAVFRHAEVVIAKCALEAAMIRAVEPAASITLIPNGVDLETFQQADISSEPPFRVLCVGRLIERKGQHHLIRAVYEAVRRGIDVTLELVGTGDALGRYKALVHKLGLEERVRFSGYVPREEIAARYAAAHVFVLPSYNEGMSVATLEAMAAGLPVVVTRTGGVEELVEEGINGLTFTWGDVATLADHLIRLATDRDLARRMGKASRARAALFSWDRAAGRFKQVLEDVAR